MANTKRPLKKSKKSVRIFQKLRVLISIAPLIFGAAILFWASMDFSVPSLSKPKVEINTASDFEKPEKIFIPRLSKVLNVSDGHLEDDRWTISETGVSFYTDSSRPGSVGNSVIYGHNRMDILGALPNLKSGDTIYVVQKSGNFVKYQITQTREIEPTEVEILDQTRDSRLTIYTCSGFLDQARFVVVAKEIKTI